MMDPTTAGDVSPARLHLCAIYVLLVVGGLVGTLVLVLGSAMLLP